MALVESRDMNSEALGRSAVWNGESRITRLPPWLTVQQVRRGAVVNSLCLKTCFLCLSLKKCLLEAMARVQSCSIH